MFKIKMKVELRYLFLVLAIISLVISCEKKDKEEDQKEVKIAEPVVKKYGFVYNNFKVVQDTIKSGDTFGTIVQNYYLPDSMNVYQLTEKIKDSFNLRELK